MNDKKNKTQQTTITNQQFTEICQHLDAACTSLQLAMSKCPMFSDLWSELNSEREQIKILIRRRYWIKERFNPQLEKPYYVAMGQLCMTAAKKYTKPLYGDNVMHSFDTEEAYKARLTELVAEGYQVLGLGIKKENRI